MLSLLAAQSPGQPGTFPQHVFKALDSCRVCSFLSLEYNLGHGAGWVEMLVGKEKLFLPRPHGPHPSRFTQGLTRHFFFFNLVSYLLKQGKQKHPEPGSEWGH